MTTSNNSTCNPKIRVLVDRVSTREKLYIIYRNCSNPMRSHKQHSRCSSLRMFVCCGKILNLKLCFLVLWTRRSAQRAARHHKKCEPNNKLKLSENENQITAELHNSLHIWAFYQCKLNANGAVIHQFAQLVITQINCSCNKLRERRWDVVKGESKLSVLLFLGSRWK